jgi:chemotaxis response regulator CheB
MPRVAIERNGAVEILPSNEIAAALVRKLQRFS